MALIRPIGTLRVFLAPVSNFALENPIFSIKCYPDGDGRSRVIQINALLSL